VSEQPKRVLMIIVSENVSEWLAKGEIVDRYYNPGDLFGEVHLVLTNDDRPDISLLQRAAGRARVEVHNVPPPPHAFRRTLAYRPLLLRRWAAGAVALAARVRPNVVRCHGANLNAFAACEIKRRLGIPYAVSLHINPDEDLRGRAAGRRERLWLASLRAVERHALRRADVVLPVYRAIVPYLNRLGVSRYQVAYNVLNGEHLTRKRDYALHDPVRVISVGRQFDAKNPEQLIRAVAALPDVELTLVGDGPLHERLREVARESGAGDRVGFRRNASNNALCRLLAEQDIFATHSEYWELSKAVLEALLAGLPVVLNRRQGAPVPELTPELAILVENEPEGYAEALRRLISDGERRERLGRTAAAYAHDHWAPEKTEQAIVEIYLGLLGETARASESVPVAAARNGA
jgi:glycosyltransferase involved in cell wall biosynthesis